MRAWGFACVWLARVRIIGTFVGSKVWVERIWGGYGVEMGGVSWGVEREWGPVMILCGNQRALKVVGVMLFLRYCGVWCLLKGACLLSF